MPQNLIIFIKNPVLGTVKTRLAKSIGDDQALLVYEDLMEKCRLETEKIDANRYLFYSTEIKEDSWSPHNFIKRIQTDGSLGERIGEAFYDVLKGEEEKTLIIGSDCFDLTSTIIEEAFEKLETTDLVLGPANDGGYYLLGTKKFFPLLYEGISWSTSKVLDQTMTQAKRLGLTISLLKELIDIDTINDLNLSSYPIEKLQE